MFRMLDALRSSTDLEENEPAQKELTKVFDKLNVWAGSMGADLGIARKGAEVHVRLPVAIRESI